MNFLTVTQYAAQRGCSTQYVRRLIASGKIKAVKVSERLWLIPIEGESK